MKTDEQRINAMLQEGLCCSQVIMKLALTLRGEKNESLLTAASGLCMGLHTGRVCGVLSAACMALALFDAKNAAEHMIPQLMEWYEETYGESFNGMDCMDICAGKFKSDRCRDILIRTWEKTKALLVEYGFDLEEGEGV